MRQYYRLFLVLALSVSLVTPVIAQPVATIPVFIDGLPVVFDVQPTVENGRTLVPFRAIAQALNVAVTWEEATRTVTATDGMTSIRLQVDNRIAYINEAPCALDVPPLLLAGRTLLPLRFFSEAFACLVTWDDAAGAVRITSPPADMTVAGYYALGSDQASSWTNLFGQPYPETATGHTDLVDELLFGWYSIDGEGTLLTRSKTGWQRPDGWEDVLRTAGDYQLATEMVIQATNTDGTLSALLASGTAQTQAVNEIMAEATRYSGVNLDFEGLGLSETGEALTSVRENLTSFVRLLAEPLHRRNQHLTLTLHAPNSAYQGYDYQALGAIADRIVIMAYDYGPRPEPIDLVIQAIEMAKASVPAGKLVLGISVPYETADSTIMKVGTAKRYGLAGIALWRLGLVPDDMWEALHRVIKTEGPLP